MAVSGRFCALGQNEAFFFWLTGFLVPSVGYSLGNLWVYNHNLLTYNFIKRYLVKEDLDKLNKTQYLSKGKFSLLHSLLKQKSSVVSTAHFLEFSE